MEKQLFNWYYWICKENFLNVIKSIVFVSFSLSHTNEIPMKQDYDDDGFANEAKKKIDWNEPTYGKRKGNNSTVINQHT